MLFYNFIYRILAILARLINPVMSPSFRMWVKTRNELQTVLSSYTEKSQNQKRILFHASSGEIEYVKSLIRELSDSKKYKIFVTYSSPSAEKLFTNIKDSVELFIPLGWDTTSDNLTLLKTIKPDFVIFSRTDLWPNLIQQINTLNIPFGAVSMYPRWNALSQFWMKFNLSQAKFLTCVSEDMTEKLRYLMPMVPAINHLNDTRFDQVKYRLSQTEKITLMSKNPIITFGSTWPKDEVILNTVLSEIIKMNFHIVWAPHDIKNASKLSKKLRSLGYKTQFTSPSKNKVFDFEKENIQILILDEIGLLADVYRHSSIAFIGGSFVSKVHSVMEPLCALNPVIVGPFYKNNPEAVQFQKLNSVFTVSSPEQFLKTFHELAQSTPILKSHIAANLKPFYGSTGQHIALINSQLLSSNSKYG